MRKEEEDEEEIEEGGEIGRRNREEEEEKVAGEIKGGAGQQGRRVLRRVEVKEWRRTRRGEKKK